MSAVTRGSAKARGAIEAKAMKRSMHHKKKRGRTVTIGMGSVLIGVALVILL